MNISQRPIGSFLGASGRKHRESPASSPWGVESATMDAVEVHSAADVERLSPDERQRLVDTNTSTDLSGVPAEFVAKARAQGRRLLVERGLITE
jgi:hypothetical protein